MTGNEKKTIWNLLKTASSALYGYDSPDFKENIDFEAKAEINEKSVLPAQNIVQSTENITNIEEKTFSEAIPQTSIQEETENFQNDAFFTLEKLSEKIKSCEKCPLKRTASSVKSGSGVKNPYVLIVLGSNYQKDIIKSSQEERLLIKMLNAVFLDPECNAYITNTVKCMQKQEFSPSHEQFEACRSFLDAELHLLKPRFILLLGEEALKTVLRTADDAKISDYRQKVLEYNKIPVLVSYSPEVLLQNPGLKGQAWADLKVLRSELDKVSPEFKYNFIPKA